MDKYKGGCSCGSVRYELDDNPVMMTACHCDACKKRTGEAHCIGIMFNDDDLKVISGELMRFSRDGESGNQVHADFCPNCGTTLRWIVDAVPNRQVFAGGAFDDTSWITIVGEMYTDKAILSGPLGCDISRPGATDVEFRQDVIEKTKSLF
tara:strand:- start:798 stop:1250 length:453 start_codon:yes stop_codon:yes gene_type:complete